MAVRLAVIVVGAAGFEPTTTSPPDVFTRSGAPFGASVAALFTHVPCIGVTPSHHQECCQNGCQC